MGCIEEVCRGGICGGEMIMRCKHQEENGRDKYGGFANVCDGRMLFVGS